MFLKTKVKMYILFIVNYNRKDRTAYMWFYLFKFCNLKTTVIIEFNGIYFTLDFSKTYNLVFLFNFPGILV